MGRKLVHLRGHKLNSQLALYLREHPLTARQATSHEHPLTYRKTAWRLQDRLTQRDMVRLIMAYKTGVATRELAERYGINVKSVRKVLRAEGMHERLRRDFR